MNKEELTEAYLDTCRKIDFCRLEISRIERKKADLVRHVQELESVAKEQRSRCLA